MLLYQLLKHFPHPTLYVLAVFFALVGIGTVAEYFGTEPQPTTVEVLQ